MMNDKQKQKFDSDEKEFFQRIGVAWPYRRPKAQWVGRPDTKKILSISDPHEQFSNQRVMIDCEKKHKDAYTVVVPGDLGDYYSKSRFKKTKHVSFDEEVRSVFLRLEWLATHWQRVYIMLGNHDDRPEKQIQNLMQLSPELLILTETNLLKQLASHFDNIEIVGTQIPHSEIYLTHIWQFGDIIFTHAEISRAQSTAVLEKLSIQLHRRKEMYGLKPYRVICQGHNHRAHKGFVGNEMWMLLPTASDPSSLAMGYAHSARMIGDPVVCGYSLFYQDRGETDINESDNVVIR